VKPNLSKIYIISWFGKDIKLRKKRKEYHTKQIDWALSKGLEVIVFAQEYEDSDYDSRVIYVKNYTTQVVFPSHARNYLLGDFYSTEDEYAMFADNDSILWNDDNHLDSRDFIDIFNKIPLTELNDIDMFVPIAPNEEPFNSFWKKNADRVANNLVFERKACCKGSLFVLRNMNKAFGVAPCFDVENFQKDGAMIGGEDNDFSLGLLNNGFGCYSCKNIVLHELASISNSTWSNKDRANDSKPMKEIFVSKYGLSQKNGRLSYDAVYKKSYRPKKLDVPKNANTVWNSLFI
jgi:hypothetical protein